MHLKRTPFCIFLISLLLSGVRGINDPASIIAETTSPSSLIRRQANGYGGSTCQADSTQCWTDRAGCCDIGSTCTTDASNRPFCAGGNCAGKINCTGSMLGACCDIGYSCDEKNYLCSPTAVTTTSTGLNEGTTTIYGTTRLITKTTWINPLAPPITSTLFETSEASEVSYYTTITSTTWDNSLGPQYTSTAAGTSYSVAAAAASQSSQASALPTAAAATSDSIYVQPPGLYFSYTTVYVTDSSSSSAAPNTTTVPFQTTRIVEHTTTVTATVTANATSEATSKNISNPFLGQAMVSFSIDTITLGCVLGLLVGYFM